MSADKLKKDIKKVVESVVNPRFDKIDADFKEVKAALKKLIPPTPPKL